MGQEASVPVGEEGQDSNNNNNGNSDAAFSLEEQAKAPPSAVHPPSSTTSGLSPQKDTSKRKLALPNILFHRSGGGNAKEQQQQQPQHHHHQAPQHSHDVESFEYREAARAAAAGGNLYHQSSSDESLTHSYTNNNNSDDHYALHRMPVSHQPGALPIHDYNNNTNDIYSASTTVSKSPPLNYSVNGRGDAGDAGLLQHRPIEGNPPATATYGTNNNINNSNSNSLTGETSGSAKKGLFSTRGAASARGMINSMRNLSLGGALRKQKEVNDWEKQWDEDEDDSDDGEGGVDTTGVAASAGQHGENSSALINGSSSLPPLVDGHLPPYLTNDAGMPMPKSPTRPPDLLDLPSAYPPASTSPQRQQYQRDHLQQTGLETWDTADLPQDQYALDVRKPDVEMFLPVLRVLGKGSFGKVRCDILCFSC